jgi:hypothetical protein
MRRQCISIAIAIAVFANTAPVRAQGTCSQWDETCKAAVKKWAIIGGIGIAGIVTLKSVMAHRARVRPPERLNPHYEPTSFRVDEHVVMRARAHCPGGWDMDQATLVRGTLPEGLTLLPDNTIAGVPVVPGVFEPTIRFRGLSCRGLNGKTQAYNDYTVRLTIRIQP